MNKKDIKTTELEESIIRLAEEILKLKDTIVELEQKKAYLEMCVSDERERNKRLAIENDNLKREKTSVAEALRERINADYVHGRLNNHKGHLTEYDIDEMFGEASRK